MSSSNEMNEQAEYLEQSGEDALALSLWRELARSHPDVEVLCRLARLAQKLGLPSEADSAFRHAVEMDPESAMPLLGWGVLGIENGDYEGAEVHLRKALRLESSALANALLGAALIGLGRSEEALNALVETIRIDPFYEEAYYKLGVLSKEANPSEAERLFNKALELDPDYSDVHRELGYLLAKRNAGAFSEYHLRRAIELNSSDAWAHVYLGNYLWAGHDINAAIAQFKTAAEIEPDRAFPLWSLGNVFEELGNLNDARQLYEGALRLEPDSPVANMNLGRVLKCLGSNDLSREYLSRALFLSPGYESARVLLGGSEPSSRLDPFTSDRRTSDNQLQRQMRKPNENN